MSNVKITGNPSGTGIFTIASPNSNNNVTYNLGTVLGNAGNSELVSTDASGNLGLGVTPSAWATFKAFQIGTGFVAGSTGTAAITGANYYYDGTYRYTATGPARQIIMDSNGFAFSLAASGTAGNAISFTQAMTLDASGNLLVGSSSSLGYRSQVFSSTNGYTQALVQTGGYASGTLSGTVFAGYYDATGITDMASIRGGKENTTSGNYGGMLAFYTRPNGGSDTERARIDSSGNLLVGTTSTDMNANNGAYIYPGGALVMSRSDNDLLNLNRKGSVGTLAVFRQANNQVGSIYVSGTGTAYNTSSDYRLKNTIAPMTGALAKVAALKPCTYKWNADGSDGEGFIAHELAEVCPQAVSGEKDAVDAEGKPVYQGIDTSFLVATLTAAIQEQQAIITAMTARIDEQQTALEALDARVKSLEAK